MIDFYFRTVIDRTPSKTKGPQPCGPLFVHYLTLPAKHRCNQVRGVADVACNQRCPFIPIDAPHAAEAISKDK